MINIYKGNGHEIQTVHSIAEGCWIHAVNPSADEIARLAQDLAVPQDFFTYPLDIDEMPRTEKDDGATLIILRVPYFAGAAEDVPYTSMPFGIILSDKVITTVCRIENGVVKDFAQGRVRGLSTAKRRRFVLHLLMSVAGKYLTNLRDINRAVDGLEDRLQRSLQNRELQELLKYQKSLVYFTTALKSNELMIERLQKTLFFQVYPDDEDLLEDVLTENRQAIEMTNIASNILSQMMDAFASIISNNLNQVMKLLASATIILTIPTMIASFYGMNVPLPAEEANYAFHLIVAVSIGIVAMLGFVFWRRDWL
jgi:magnesium transporter